MMIMTLGKSYQYERSEHPQVRWVEYERIRAMSYELVSILQSEFKGEVLSERSVAHHPENTSEKTEQRAHN